MTAIFNLDETCSAEVRPGKKPVVVLSRRRIDKPPSYIMLSSEEWSMMVNYIPLFDAEFEDIKHEEVFTLNFTPSRVLTLTSYHDIDYVGVFKYEDGQVRYYYGLNLTSAAWKELCQLQDKIGKILSDMTLQSTSKEPSKRNLKELASRKKLKLSLPKLNSGEQCSAAPSEPPKLTETNVTVYKWVKTSDDGCLMYDESKEVFYTKAAAMRDADRHPVDFSDTFGLKTSTKGLEKTIFHPTFDQVVEQTYKDVLRTFIMKRLTNECVGCLDDQPGQLAHKDGCLAVLDRDLVQAYLPRYRNIISHHTLSQIIQTVTNILGLVYDDKVVVQCTRGKIETLPELDSTDCSKLIHEVVNVRVY